MCCKLYFDLNRRTFRFPYIIVIRSFTIWVTELGFTVQWEKFRPTLGTRF
jgi:hypothetical protein